MIGTDVGMRGSLVVAPEKSVFSLMREKAENKKVLMPCPDCFILWMLSGEEVKLAALSVLWQS